MVQVQATVVSIGLKLSGDVATFTQAQREGLRNSLRASLSCQEPACFLTLRVQAGSINVDGILTIPQTPSAGAPATPAATIAAVQAAATTLVSSTPAAISSSLGLSVTSIDPSVQTQADVVVPLAMAPPPPSLPPIPPLAPPVPPRSPVAVNASKGSYSYGSYSYSYSYSYGQSPTGSQNGTENGTLQGSGDTQTAGRVVAPAVALIGIIAGVACALAVVVVACLVRRRLRPRLPLIGTSMTKEAAGPVNDKATGGAIQHSVTGASAIECIGSTSASSATDPTANYV